MSTNQPTATATPRTSALDWHKHAANDINLEYWTKRKDGGWPTDASLAAIIADHDQSAKTSTIATPRTDAAIQRRNFGSGDIDWVSVRHARTLERELSSAQAALAEAKAEVARFIHDKGATNGRIQSQYFELTELRARVAELEQDKARIDWLLDQGLCWRDCDKEIPGEHWVVGERTEWLYRAGGGRDRIDAARKGQP